MKIHSVKLENFMLFDRLEAEFSPHINLFIGENSTGKTTLFKALYASARAYNEAQIAVNKIPDTIDNGKNFPYAQEDVLNLRYQTYWRTILQSRLAGVFHLDNMEILNLANRYNINNTMSLHIGLENNEYFLAQFSESALSPIPIPYLSPRDYGNTVYIPTGEMISHTENFASLYEEYHIPFDETCYDLVRLLDRPQKRRLPEALQAVADTLEKTIGGKVIQKGRVFYLLIDGEEKIEMSLISEGYRKLATLLALLGSGALSDGSILFWDEPEANMNPKMVKTLVDALLVIANEGVQVFVSTHDYFVQQYFGLAASYKEKYGEDAGKLDFRFFSLYRETIGDRKTDSADRESDRETAKPTGRPTGRVAIESAARLVDLNHNTVNEENDTLYDREVGIIYGNDA